MTSQPRQHIQLLIAIFIVLAAGTMGYMFLETGWSLLDALYMTVITITTIGFGEIHELSTAGRIFTIGLIFTGLGLAAVFATQVAKVIVQAGARNLYEKRKMKDRINKVSSHTLVCGYGKIGRAICLKLFELGLDFVVVDTKEEQLGEARQRGYLALCGDAAVDGVLLSAGIRKAEYIVLCINDDAANINISLAARELNPDIYIVARGSDPAIEYRMLRAGANTVVYPLALGGEQIAHILARQAGVTESPAVENGHNAVMGHGLKIFRNLGDAPVSVKDALQQTAGIAAIALKRIDGAETENPSNELLLAHGDSLLVLVRSDECSDCHLANAIRWSDKLLLGIPSIDAEHRVLVKYAEDFQKAVNENAGHEAIARLFDRLLEYTTSHFAREEALMQKREYPHMEEHVNEHRRITREVMELNRDKRYVFPASVDSFLEDWIINHINQTDRQYVEYLKK